MESGAVGTQALLHLEALCLRLEPHGEVMTCVSFDGGRTGL